jgi:hypothetical protein
MRLITQHYRPVREIILPSWPLRRASNGTEHASFGSRVDDPIPGWEAEPFEFSLHGPVVRSANNTNLSGSHRLPLPDQVA